MLTFGGEIGGGLGLFGFLGLLDGGEHFFESLGLFTLMFNKFFGLNLFLSFGNEFFGLFHFVLEFFYTTLSIDETHFAGEKGVACRADVDLEFWHGGAGFKSVAAGTGDFGIKIVFGVDVFLHRLEV